MSRIILFGLCLSSLLFSNLSSASSWWVGSSVGLVQTATVTSSAQAIDDAQTTLNSTFNSHSTDNGLSYFSLSGGYLLTRPQPYFAKQWFSLGLWQMNRPVTVSGELTTPGFPDFNRSQQYHVNLSGIRLGYQADIMTYNKFSPYVGLGLSSASVDFRYAPNSGDDRQYASNSHTDLLYDINLGADYQIASHLQAQLGYRYMPSIKIKSGRLTASNSAPGAYPGITQTLNLGMVMAAVKYQF